jgi:hypothetical protein
MPPDKPKYLETIEAVQDHLMNSAKISLQYSIYTLIFS